MRDITEEVQLIFKHINSKVGRQHKTLHTNGFWRQENYIKIKNSNKSSETSNGGSNGKSNRDL